MPGKVDDLFHLFRDFVFIKKSGSDVPLLGIGFWRVGPHVAEEAVHAFFGHDRRQQIKAAGDPHVAVQLGDLAHQFRPDQRRIFVAPDGQGRVRGHPPDAVNQI
jgi:hypothetical protein